MTYFIFRN